MTTWSKTLLSDLSELQAKRVVNLMLTSRYIPRVVYYVQSDMTLEVRASDEDVRRYVDGRMNELPKFISKRPKLQQSVKDAVASAVDGM